LLVRTEDPVRRRFCERLTSQVGSLRGTGSAVATALRGLVAGEETEEAQRGF
jgi:hypothetical protein